MIDINAVLAAANKHWKFCVYYLLLGYCVRIVQAVLPLVAMEFTQDLLVAAAIVAPGVLIGNKFTNTKDELEKSYFRQVTALALLAGLLAGRIARFIIAGR